MKFNSKTKNLDRDSILKLYLVFEIKGYIYKQNIILVVTRPFGHIYKKLFFFLFIK